MAVLSWSLNLKIKDLKVHTVINGSFLFSSKERKKQTNCMTEETASVIWPTQWFIITLKLRGKKIAQYLLELLNCARAVHKEKIVNNGIIVTIVCIYANNNQRKTIIWSSMQCAFMVEITAVYSLQFRINGYNCTWLHFCTKLISHYMVETILVICEHQNSVSLHKPQADKRSM